MYMVRSWIAKALGEDPAPFQKRADEIKDLLLRLLWNEEGGFLYDSLGVDGRRKPTTIAPTIYHAIEFDMVTGRNAERMFDWMTAHLMSPAGLVRVNDWFPINWSHNVYSPNETGNAAVAAFHLRRGEAGMAMLRGIAKGTLERTLVPGAIMCMASSDGAQKNGADFGDGVSLFLRATIEGLFGVRMNRPEGVLRLEPNFPGDWDRAEITVPDLGRLAFRKERAGDVIRHVYSLTMKTPLRISASLPAEGPVRNVRVNGQPVESVPSVAGAGGFVELDIPPSTDCEIGFETGGIGNRPAGKTLAQPTPGSLPADISQPEPSGSQEYEPIRLGGAAPVPFERAYKLFPGEQVWNLDQNQKWRFIFDRRFAADSTEVRVTSQQIPFLFDKQNILAFKKQHQNALWGGVNPDFAVPQTLRVSVGKPAREVCLLASGLCSVMTFPLPQVEVALEYEGGQTIRRQLTAPDEFDFITQHTSVHSSVAVGWFGTEAELRDMEKKRAQAGDPLFNINHRLHADMIRLKGVAGVLKQISLAPLQRHSGMVLYGVTLVK